MPTMRCAVCEGSAYGTAVDSTVSPIRLTSKFGCSWCSLVLACVDWTVPRLLQYKDITRVKASRNGMIVLSVADTSVVLECLEVSGEKISLAAAPPIFHATVYSHF